MFEISELLGLALEEDVVDIAPTEQNEPPGGAAAAAAELERCERIYSQHKARLAALSESEPSFELKRAQLVCQMYSELMQLPNKQAEKLERQLTQSLAQ